MGEQGASAPRLKARKRDRDEGIAWGMSYCTHYDGRAIFMKPFCCRAGVKYDDVGNIKTRPCINGHKLESATAICPKWERTSLEAATKSADEMDRKMNNILLVMPAVSAWRNKKRPFEKAGSIECPVCKGTLELSQSGHNGHVWGKCKTEGCAEWME